MKKESLIQSTRSQVQKGGNENTEGMKKGFT